MKKTFNFKSDFFNKILYREQRNQTALLTQQYLFLFLIVQVFV